jgi:hypothetical protein
VSSSAYYSPCRTEFECRVCQVQADLNFRTEEKDLVPYPVTLNIERISKFNCFGDYLPNHVFQCMYPPVEWVRRTFPDADPLAYIQAHAEARDVYKDRKHIYNSTLKQGRDVFLLSMIGLVCYLLSGVYMLLWSAASSRYACVRYLSLHGVAVLIARLWGVQRDAPAMMVNVAVDAATDSDGDDRGMRMLLDSSDDEPAPAPAATPAKPIEKATTAPAASLARQGSSLPASGSAGGYQPPVLPPLGRRAQDDHVQLVAGDTGVLSPRGASPAPSRTRSSRTRDRTASTASRAPSQAPSQVPSQTPSQAPAQSPPQLTPSRSKSRSHSRAGSRASSGSPGRQHTPLVMPLTLNRHGSGSLRPVSLRSRASSPSPARSHRTHAHTPASSHHSAESKPAKPKSLAGSYRAQTPLQGFALPGQDPNATVSATMPMPAAADKPASTGPPVGTPRLSARSIPSVALESPKIQGRFNLGAGVLFRGEDE